VDVRCAVTRTPGSALLAWIFCPWSECGITIYRSATFEKDRADASFEGYLKRELPGSLTIAVVEE
jgi:hypothetical protein